jgi:hypothetical protein
LNKFNCRYGKVHVQVCLTQFHQIGH